MAGCIYLVLLATLFVYWVVFGYCNRLILGGLVYSRLGIFC